MTLNSTSNGQQLELGSIINSAYQSLLNQNLETTGQALTKVCSNCGIEKPIEAFRVTNKNTGWTRSGCYQCEREYGKQLNWVHRNSPPIGSVCEFPGCNSTENLVLHHVQGRLSSRDVYKWGGYYFKATALGLRHESR